MTYIIKKLDVNSTEDKFLLLTDLYKFKLDLYKNYYPDVNKWYQEKFVKSFLDEKRIVLVVKNENNLYGLSIIKISNKPYNKLCTFYLLPEIRNNGLGKILMEESLKQISNISQNKSVLITIPQERISENIGKNNFLNFLSFYGFNLIDIIPNRYRLGKDEYICSLKPIKNNSLINERYEEKILL